MQQWKFPFALVVVTALVGLGVYWLRQPPSPPPPDMTKVLEANNRGIGHMEQFEYHKAITEFEEVVRLAPDWTPGQINLGIALFNRGGKIQATTKGGADMKGDDLGDMTRAIGIFERILARDADNPYAHFCLGIIYTNRGDNNKKDLENAAKHFDA